MKRPAHTLIPFGIALAVVGVGSLAGLSFGASLIVGALVGIFVSILLQRRDAHRSPNVVDVDDPADVDAAVDSVGQAALDFRTRSANITDPGAADLASRLNDEFSTTVRTLQDPARSSAASLLLDQVLEPAAALMTDYAWLQDRGGLGTGDMMRRIAVSDLPKIEIAIRQANAVMARQGELDMNALRRAVGFTLDEPADDLVTDPADWGNRQRLVERAERLGTHKASDPLSGPN